MTTFLGASGPSGDGSFLASGLLVVRSPQGIHYVTRYMGEAEPRAVRNRRRSVHDAMRRLGTPVLVKHMWNAQDVRDGLAQTSPGFDAVYGQARSKDLSHGVGYVSQEVARHEWIAPDGEIVVAQFSPGKDYLPAPRFRGYGPGYITYVIEPDRKIDEFRLSPGGAILRIQDATFQAPWWPMMNDNDLLINIELAPDGTISNTLERYQLKQVNPTTLHLNQNNDKRGHREPGGDGGNRWLINQSFDATLVPEGVDSPIYDVECDR